VATSASSGGPAQWPAAGNWILTEALVELTPIVVDET
jgi:hypothetical protein